MPSSFQPDATIYLAYTFNNVCYKGHHVTPFELYSGHKPSVSYLKPFGTQVYIGVPRAACHSKFDAQAKSGQMTGYGMRTKGYHVWLGDERKVIETINVCFKVSVNSTGHNDEPMLNFFSESTTSEGEESEYTV